MRKTTKRIVPLVVASLALAACGGDSSTETTEADSGGADTTEGAAETDTTEAEGGTDTTEADIGGTDTTEAGMAAAPEGEPIVVGVLGDLTGPFAGLVTEIVEAQQIYWDAVNANGGIGGRPVELLVEDAEYNVALTQEKYAILQEEADIISLSTGSPHTASIQQNLVDDGLIALPLTWYSGWAFNDGIGENVYENYTNYCLESMNAVEYLAGTGIETVAIVSFPGEYGGDGAAGAKIAAEALGLEVVYDGAGAVTPPSADNPQPDQSAVISEIVAANPDAVWATVNPGTLGQLMGGAATQGFQGQWSGNSPTYSYKLLDSELAPLLDQYYTQSTYTVTYGSDVPGMADMVDKMTAARPDLPVSDAYILGWTEAITAHKIMLKAFEDGGEVTRETILAAAAEIEIDYDGLAPTQTWAGEPNDYVVRQSYLYDISTADYTKGATLAEGGTTGSVALEGVENPYQGELVANYDFTEPCFQP